MNTSYDDERERKKQRLMYLKKDLSLLLEVTIVAMDTIFNDGLRTQIEPPAYQMIKKETYILDQKIQAIDKMIKGLSSPLADSKATD